MDVKSSFINGFIKEDVYVEEPPDFKTLEKDLFSLQQAHEPSMKDFRPSQVQSDLKEET